MAGDHFRLELLPARHGDCIVLGWGDPAAPHLLLVDGGPHTAYATLATRLTGVRRLEAVVVTHIDNDHIGGIVRLLGDDSLSLDWGDFWFNGWDQITRPLHGLAAAPAAAPAIAAQRSALEGQHVAARVARRGARINAAFGGQALCVAGSGVLPVCELPGGLELTVLSPDVAALRALRLAWDRALQRLHLDPTNPAAMQRGLDADRRYRGAGNAPLSPQAVHELATVACAVDEAVANGSSIAFVASYRGRRVALLGDAHPPVLEAALRRLAAQEGQPRVRLDAVKLPHHGSKANVRPQLLQLLDCPRWLVSTDGSIFGHPDDEAIAQVLQASAVPAQLLFNHHTERLSRWGDAALQRSLGYTAGFPPPGTAGGMVLDLL